MDWRGRPVQGDVVSGGLGSWWDLPIPNPSVREASTYAADATGDALRLLADHATVVGALCRRSPADFRPLPTLMGDIALPLRRAFGSIPGSRPSMVAALAPLVAPRLERVVDGLRQRLSRERHWLPLHAVREMDPACLRQNARLSGRTLIEKAGPRQRLMAVQRVPRFDTMENRVLVAAARRLNATALAELGHGAPDALGDDPAAKALRRLCRACSAVLSRPELEDVGSLQPDERPSNALLGDAEYRSAWRAWRLLCREEERFAEEWAAIDAVWIELLLLAVWAWMDTLAEPLPDWMTVLDGRTSGSRIQTGTDREWVVWQNGIPSLVSVVAPRTSGQPIVIRVTGPQGEVREVSVVTGIELGSADGVVRLHDSTTLLSPTLQLAVWRVSTLAEDLGLGGCRWEAPSPSRVGELVGLCALDADVVRWNEEGLRSLGPAAAGELDVPDESALFLCGRAATWLPCRAGPAVLASSELGGALLESYGGNRDTAVVVPDGLEEVGIARFRQRLGRAWLVWSPIAAVLAEDPGPFDCRDEPMYVAVVVLCDAMLDVAVLERRTEDGARWWIRSAPLRGSAAGRERRRFGDTTPGTWLRDPSSVSGWEIQDHRLQFGDFPTLPDDVVSDVCARLAIWTGPRFERIVCVGLDEVQRAKVSKALKNLPIHVAEPGALARGAHTFLVRHRTGLPTWKDRIPQLDVQVRDGRNRRLVTLVEPRLVAPGETISMRPEQIFVLEHAQDCVLFDLRQGGRDVPWRIRIDGPPLPLREPARVRIEVRYVYGLGALAGHLIPQIPGLFPPVPFRITDEAPSPPEEVTGPPPLPPCVPLTIEQQNAVRDRLSALENWWRKFPKSERSRVAAQAGVVDKELRSLLDPLKRALSAVPSSEHPGFRGFLEDSVVGMCEWLLGIGRRSGAGEPPKLSRDLKVIVAQCRSATGVRGDERYAKWVLDLPPAESLLLLGQIIDGRADLCWDDLVSWPIKEPGLSGAWARAIVFALRAQGGLPRHLSLEQIESLFQRAIDLLTMVSNLETTMQIRHGQAVYRLSLVFVWLCAVRDRGLLLPSDPMVVAGREQLETIRLALHPDLLRIGGREAATTNDEPLSVAIDWLNGRYDSLPILENP